MAAIWVEVPDECQRRRKHLLKVLPSAVHSAVLRDASVLPPTPREVSTVRRRTVVSLALFLTAAAAPAVRAQTRTLTGRVYDDATQQGIPGALVSATTGSAVA